MNDRWEIAVAVDLKPPVGGSLRKEQRPGNIGAVRLSAAKPTLLKEARLHISLLPNTSTVTLTRNCSLYLCDPGGDPYSVVFGHSTLICVGVSRGQQVSITGQAEPWKCYHSFCVSG